MPPKSKENNKWENVGYVLYYFPKGCAKLVLATHDSRTLGTWGGSQGGHLCSPLCGGLGVEPPQKTKWVVFGPFSWFFGQ